MSRYKLPFFACPADFKGLCQLSVGLIRLMFYYGHSSSLHYCKSFNVREGAILVVHNCMMNNACNSRSWLGWCLFSMILWDACKFVFKNTHSLLQRPCCFTLFRLHFLKGMRWHLVGGTLRATPERPPKTHVSRSRLLQSAEAICDLKMSSHETKYCWEALGFMMFPLQRQLSLGYSPALGPNLLVCYHIDQDQLV